MGGVRVHLIGIGNVPVKQLDSIRKKLEKDGKGVDSIYLPPTRIGKSAAEAINRFLPLVDKIHLNYATKSKTKLIIPSTVTYIHYEMCVDDNFSTFDAFEVSNAWNVEFKCILHNLDDDDFDSSDEAGSRNPKLNIDCDKLFRFISSLNVSSFEFVGIEPTTPFWPCMANHPFPNLEEMRVYADLMDTEDEITNAFIRMGANMPNLERMILGCYNEGTKWSPKMIFDMGYKAFDGFKSLKVIELEESYYNGDRFKQFADDYSLSNHPSFYITSRWCDYDLLGGGSGRVLFEFKNGVNRTKQNMSYPTMEIKEHHTMFHLLKPWEDKTKNGRIISINHYDQDPDTISVKYL